MVVGVLTVELFLAGATSLKDKRRVLKSILDKIKARFNVSVAEVDKQEAWQFSVLGVAAVSSETGHVYQTLAAVARFIEGMREVEVTKVNTEVF
ncbi:MAG: DUF503 domain-containing protein [Armatimonadetes bacterium]|nr:DUF503 domain-containing protein [Armatimonadota bacterium]